MVIYFFDILGLSFIMAPEFNREFGVIENIQLLIILSIFIVSYKSYRNSKINLAKYVFLGVSLFSIFLFLEEIDYGLHLFEYFSGKSTEEVLVEHHGNQIRNIHNQGNITQDFKLAVYISFVLFLVIIPIIVRKIKLSNQYLDLVIPSKYFIYSLISMALLNRLALFIDKNIKYNYISSLNSNISEFEEIFICYIMLLYLLELTHRKFPDWKKKVVKMCGN